jgi:hypothetical protein
VALSITHSYLYQKMFDFVRSILPYKKQKKKPTCLLSTLRHTVEIGSGGWTERYKKEEGQGREEIPAGWMMELSQEAIGS